MHDTKDEGTVNAKIDAIGILLLAIGVGALQVVLERGNREDWFDSSLIQCLSATAAIGLILFVIWELRVPNPCVNLRVLKNRSLAAASVFSTVVGFGLYGSLFILPVFLQEVRGYTAMQTGRMLIVDGTASAISMAIVGAAVSRFISRNLVGLGVICFAGAMLFLGSVNLDTGPEHLFIPYILRGASLGLIYVPLSLAALAGLEGKEMADGSGLFNLTRQWGGSAGIAFLSTLLDHRLNFHRAMLVDNVNVYNPTAQWRMRQAVGYLQMHGQPAIVAKKQALALMDQSIQLQSYVMAFDDAFMVMGVVFILSLPLLLLFKKSKALAGSMGMGH